MNKNYFIKQARYFSSILLIFFLFSACTVEDVIEDITDGNDFTAKVDGNNFNAAKGEVIIDIQEGPNFYYIIILAHDITGLSKTDAILLTMIGGDFNELTLGKFFEYPFEEDINNIAGAGAMYIKDWDFKDDDIDFATESVESVFIKVTALDRDNKLISGEFNFISIDDDTNKKYTVTDGKFTNIKYKLKTN